MAKAPREAPTHVDGKFESPFDAYPGYIQLPHPFLGIHYKKWLAEMHQDVDHQKNGIDIDALPVFIEWKAAFVITEIHLDNLSMVDVDKVGDSVPLEIQTWIRECVNAYTSEILNLKN